MSLAGAPREYSPVPKTENFQWYVEQVAQGEVHGHAITETLVSGRSEYQAYAIVRSALFGKMLVLDGDTQSSELDEQIYHESLVHPACVAFGGDPRRALILGGGEGASLRELLRLRGIERVTMVDIDGEVVQACRRHMPEWGAGAFEDARAETVIGDARSYVFASQQQYDVIIGDLTEPLSDSPSVQLHTPEMYRAIQARLSSGGVFALQASTSGPHNCTLHVQMIDRLREIFALVVPYSVYVPAFDTEWGFALCGSGFAVEQQTEAGARAAAAYAQSLPGLGYYDAVSHRRMFNLPRFLRDAYRGGA